MGNLLCFAGRRVQSVAISERAQAAGEATGDAVSQISANTNLGLNAYSAGDYRKAQAFQERILELIPPDRARERFGRALLPAVNAHGNLALALAQRGAFVDAVRHGQAAIGLADEVSHPYSLGVAAWHLGRIYTLRGDLAEARLILTRARSVAQELTIGFLIPAVALELSVLSVLEGRVKDALNLVPAAQAAIAEVGLRWWEALAELRMGEALFAAGRFYEARIAAMRALDFTRERGSRAGRRGRCGSSARSTPIHRRPPLTPLRASTDRPSRLPNGSACAPLSPTATSASARFTVAPTTERRRLST
jgi:tetratricopeptide (TPR) repeat protein